MHKKQELVFLWQAWIGYPVHFHKQIHKLFPINEAYIYLLSELLIYSLPDMFWFSDDAFYVSLEWVTEL